MTRAPPDRIAKLIPLPPLKPRLALRRPFYLAPRSLALSAFPWLRRALPRSAVAEGQKAPEPPSRLLRVAHLRVRKRPLRHGAGGGVVPRVAKGKSAPG